MTFDDLVSDYLLCVKGIVQVSRDMNWKTDIRDAYIRGACNMLLCVTKNPEEMGSVILFTEQILHSEENMELFLATLQKSIQVSAVLNLARNNRLN